MVEWQKTEESVFSTSRFPHEYVIDSVKHLTVQHRQSWVIAAVDCGIPIFVPGWEDSSLGNAFTANVIAGRLKPTIMKTGIDYMVELVNWYRQQTAPIGFFQIGGGVAGDFAICSVPLINQELIHLDNSVVKVPTWAYFCNITDSVESYGSYSGAGGSEKITWGKLEKNTPMFTINSDATIVAPLIFAYVLGW
jgi:deoxyhypusine synthase